MLSGNKESSLEHLTTIVYTKKGKGGGGGNKQSALWGIRKLGMHFPYKKSNGEKLLGLGSHMKGAEMLGRNFELNL